MITASCAVLAPLSEPAACVTTVQKVTVGAVLLAGVVIAQRTYSLRSCPSEGFAAIRFEGVAVGTGA